MIVLSVNQTQNETFHSTRCIHAAYDLVVPLFNLKSQERTQEKGFGSWNNSNNSLFEAK